MKRIAGCSPLARVLAHLIPVENGCLIWEGCCSRWGYGQVNVGGVIVYVHRWVWELVHGPIPDGWEVDHLCRNRRCGKLEHLEAVPKAVNTLRGVGQSAVHARKTHCPVGHPYDVLVRRGNGRVTRRCRRCEAVRANWRDRPLRGELEGLCGLS